MEDKTSMDILFCNIAYMKYYDVDLIEEKPKHGGQYVAETGDALEKFNFHVCEDSKCRGFVETKYRDSYKNGKLPYSIRIENINPLFKNSEAINGVTVVFCAHSDIHKKSVIIGWYGNATVFRNRKNIDGREYNLECDAQNAYLINECDRHFIVPRASNSDFGFGQSNVWYAKEEKASDFVRNVLDYINNYNIIEENLPQAIPEEYKESGIGKKVLVNKYERNSNARRKCLEIYGSKCIVCGFESARIYGDEFSDRIEVHHIVPINEINKKYKVDPQKDIVPVCPNCHMMLHTKMIDGKYPTIELLKSIVRKNKQ